MKIEEIIGNIDCCSKRRRRKQIIAREKAQDAKILPIIYGDNEREREDLEIQKMRAEIEAISAQAELRRKEAGSI